MIKSLFFNANGLRHRIDDLKQFVSLNGIDLIFIAETHSKDSISNSFSNPFFNIPAFNGPSGGLIGGIAAFCPYGSKIIKHVRLLAQEAHWAIINVQNHIMACSYFPPSIDCKESLKELLTSLEDFSQNWELPVF
jgi:hypothetical protein